MASAGTDGRTHRQRVTQGNVRRLGTQGNAQGKVAAQRESGNGQGQAFVLSRDGAHGTDDFIDATGMEQLCVEMMGFAVIAEIQAKHIEAFGQQARSGVQEIARLHAAFPAVQQHHQAAGARQALLRRVHAEQAHALATIEQMFARATLQCRQPRTVQQAPHATGCQHRLHMRIAQPARRLEIACLEGSSCVRSGRRCRHVRCKPATHGSP
jgi:hypothetical protein